MPASPRAGTLFEVHVHVRGQVAEGWSATAAGIPLHARADSTGGGVVLFAAMPIDSARGIELRFTCANGALPTAVRIPADSGHYRMERLRVAPRFAVPPDSALAARLRVESERAAAVSERSHDTPPLWRTPFRAPRPSRVTSGFGTGRTFNGAVVSRHMGIDYAGAVGAPVRAANRGVVRLVSAFYLGGNVVYVDHGAGLVTAYLHLSQTLVTEGDTVPQGAVLGRVGATGRVTGPHLHLIARFGSTTVDPMSLIGRR